MGMGVGEIPERQDGVDARQGPCGARVDAEDTSVGERASDDRRVTQIIEMDVVDEGAAPGQKSRILAPGDRGSDIARFRH